MSAATDARDGLRKPLDLIEFPLAAGVKVFKDTMLFNYAGTGAVGPARTGTATDVFVGFARDTKDNTGGAAAAVFVRVDRAHSSYAFPFADGPVTFALNDKAAYAADDSTLTATATGAVQVGVFIYDRDLAAAGLVRLDPRKGVQ